MVERVVDSPKWGINTIKGAGDELVEVSFRPRMSLGPTDCASAYSLHAGVRFYIHDDVIEKSPREH